MRKINANSTDDSLLMPANLVHMQCFRKQAFCLKRVMKFRILFASDNSSALLLDSVFKKVHETSSGKNQKIPQHYYWIPSSKKFMKHLLVKKTDCTNQNIALELFELCQVSYPHPKWWTSQAAWHMGPIIYPVPWMKRHTVKTCFQVSLSVYPHTSLPNSQTMTLLTYITETNVFHYK